MITRSLPAILLFLIIPRMNASGQTLPDSAAVAAAENLKKGRPKDEALRQAKLTLLKGEAAHPCFWSGFVGIGDMGKL